MKVLSPHGGSLGMTDDFDELTVIERNRASTSDDDAFGLLKQAADCPAPWGGKQG